MFAVPVLDVSPYLAPGAHAGNDPACARVAAELDRACREVGFLQITGHGVPVAATEGLADALDAFFGLPLEAKKPYRRPGENRGYSPPKSESLSRSLGIETAMNDFYESFTVGSERSWYPGLTLPEASYADNTWPDAAPDFRPAVEAYFAQVTALSRVLLRVFTDALGLPLGYFDSMTGHSIDALKMNNYALPEGEVAGEILGMGAHTDFGILTVLWADQVPGLQVLDSDGVWHDVQPAQGAFLVNLGDAMARWTNDRWMSTVHRVDPPVVDGTIVRRRSAAFFFDGDHDAVIEALPGCADTASPGYPPITVAENIAMKVAGLKGGALADPGLREAERVRAAR
ncbi:isopenicillin N synthase family dioxygenase [Actinocorallia sp. A-T 12471]|uniref:isopenicillin N synthase family dioxygenase n=1 Tax=Actinocorallia sp. A-T 12471 TaxID=3089813 RepID=UPI0029CB997E|nr:2-oxoglutarate and iron-dependent oxygenase domain-containing protein [Actinocorallia sp. A-T 12471]MDX6740125.1 2-oxoglutarate and iron-dependent oxygenase domain-containing protein [Actinocorallia sp. A-T 12471]